jgi:hypothetical protein
MNYLLAFLFPVLAGWSLAAANALWKAADRPPVLQGTGGRFLLITVYVLTGLLLAAGIVWMFHTLRTSHLVIVIFTGGLLGTSASRRLHVNAAGAINRLVTGVAGLLVAYVIAWVLVHPA